MKKTNLVFHPFIIALYPATTLYLQNYNNVPFQDTLLSFTVISLSTILLWLSANYFTKDINKGALITSVFFLLFFSYGHIMAALSNYLHSWFGVDQRIIIKLYSRPPMLTLLVIWILLFVLIMSLTIKSKYNFRAITQFMNVVSVVLAMLAVSKTLLVIVSSQKVIEKLESNINYQFELQPLPPNSHLEASKKPDIYYIILDGYARADIMKSIYEYDNSSFIDFLYQNNFYVAEDAHTNYNYTFLSLASSLNFSYLDSIMAQFSKEDTNPSPFVSAIENNRLMRFLDEQEYETIVFPSGYSQASTIKSDLTFFPSTRLNSFQDNLINKTPLRFGFQKLQYALQRERLLYQLENIPGIPASDYPQFIFAHILLPHPPFVFQADGSPFNPDWDFILNDGELLIEWIGKDSYIQGYHNQAIFTSNQATRLIEKLLTLDPTPIIILQSDHGPGSQHSSTDLQNTNINERFSILNAYYFPDQDYTQLYPSITPVNTFRVILNQYFGTNYALLEDQSYWIAEALPYDPTEVTDLLEHP